MILESLAKVHSSQSQADSRVLCQLGYHAEQQKGKASWRHSLSLIVNAAMKEILFYQNKNNKTEIS